MSFLDVIPQPRRFSLGGSAYLVSPLRLRDIAILEAWAASREAGPLDLVRESIQSAEAGTERDKLVRAAWLATESAEAACCYGSAELDDRLRTDEGVKMLLIVVLGRHQPHLTGAEVDAIYDTASKAEYYALERFVFAAHPLDELSRYIDPPVTSRPGRKTSWAKAYCSLASRFPWLSLDAFGDLSITQLIALQSEGEHEPGGQAEGESWQVFASRRAAFFAEPEA